MTRINVCDVIKKQEQDKRYLNDKLIQAYTKIKRMHDNIQQKDIDADNQLKFIHSLLDIVNNGGKIDKKLFLILIAENGLI